MIPESVLEYGFDFDWNVEKVWQLDYPIIKMDITELEWHFDIPFWDWNNEEYKLKPREVINNPEEYKLE